MLPLILKLVTVWRLVVSLNFLLYLQWKEPWVPIEQESGWVPDLVGIFWRTGKSLDPAGIQVPDCAAHIVISVLTT